MTAKQTYFTFDRSALVPDAWREIFVEGARVFNPTITPVADGYAMCYRVVSLKDDVRRLATCRLTPDFAVVPGSVIALSDLVSFADAPSLDQRALTWHADPRYHVVGGRIFVSWNDGGNKPANHQFLQELDETGTRPVGKAREILVSGFERRTTEKNWMFVESGGKVYVVYSIWPHLVLSADLSDPVRVRCQPVAEVDWVNPYSEVFGVMRGGAQPLMRDGRFLSAVHSSFKVPGGRKYELCFYEFSPKAPFEPLRVAPFPTPLPMDGKEEFQFAKLNREVLSVVYPCGMALDGDDVVIAYGINDEDLAIARLPFAAIDETLEPVQIKNSWQTAQDAERWPASRTRGLPTAVPLFWWDAAGKRFDGAGGTRLFNTGNFGDIASMDIVQRISGKKVRPNEAGERKLVSIGSVLHTAGDGDVIWGSGVKGTVRKMDPKVKTLDIRAVCGPLTLDFLRERGFDVSKVTEVFDPGCLVPQVYAKELAAHDRKKNARYGNIRIVAHYRDDLLMRRMYQPYLRSFLSVDCTPLDMARAMLGAEAVYSSSLHGIIFAESLGIPAYWLRSVGGEDSYKFYDYYYGTGRYGVKCFETLEDAFKGTPMPLPKLRPDDFLATFPHDALTDLAGAGLTYGKSMIPSQAFDHEWEKQMRFDLESGRPGVDGFWFTAKTGSLAFAMSFPRDRGAMVRLVIRPHNPHKLPSPQAITVAIGGGYIANLAWARGNEDPKTVICPVTPEMIQNNWLQLEFTAEHALSDKEIGAGRREEVLTHCVMEIGVVVPEQKVVDVRTEAAQSSLNEAEEAMDAGAAGLDGEDEAAPVIAPPKQTKAAADPAMAAVAAAAGKASAKASVKGGDVSATTVKGKSGKEKAANADGAAPVKPAKAAASKI